jgi:hypothetical protein
LPSTRGRRAWPTSYADGGASPSPPTGTHRDQYLYALEAFGPVLEQLRSVIDRLEALEAELDELGAPWTPGRVPGG